jgi:hypothetical protein
MPLTTVSGEQRFFEMPPCVERPLYLICCDSTIREADPTESLYKALVHNNFCRLTAAKTLTAESKCLQRVPVIARERFLELLEATPITAGTAFITNNASVHAISYLHDCISHVTCSLLCSHDIATSQV